VNDDYRYLDPNEFDDKPLPPCNDSPEDALFYGIRDLIRFTVNEGLSDEEVDRVLKRIMDERANETRARFVLHTRDDDEE